ncbi:hypothetical protein ANN_17305, partial [Periplaneta americana]
FRKYEYDNVLKMTEMFVWEDMPEKDPKVRNLTMAGWIPRAVGLILGFSTCFAFPALYVTSVCIACSQLEKLESNLHRIQHEYGKSNDEADSNIEKDFMMQRELNECVQHHQKIIRYLNALETAMNMPIGGILLVQLITLCIVAFSVIVNWGDILDMIQSVTLYIALMLIVFTFCGMGTVITDKYESVREAAWSSDWVGAPVSYQRCILFIIAKSNQEFQLTACKFVPLSNTTMMS